MGIFIRNKPYTDGLQAVILDWAGTCVDYGCVGPVAPFVEAFKRYGVDLALFEARGPMGLAKKDHVRALLKMPSVAERWKAANGRPVDEKDVAAVYGETERLMIAALANHAEPIPGALEAIKKFRAMGLKVGTCTGYTTPMVNVLAPAAAAKGFVPDAVVCASDVPAGRPYPFMCYLNAIKLGVYPLEACVKIGDTVADIHEGLNAGMWAVGLSKTGNEIGLPEAQVAAMEPSELERKLAEVEERFGEAGAHYVVENISDCVKVLEEINHRIADGEQP